MDKKKNKKKIKRIKIIVGSLLLVVVAIALIFIYLVNRINHVEIEKTDEALGITQEINMEKETVKSEVPTENKYDDKIINIALFGLDRRDSKEEGRADATMILTIDFKTNKIKVSSLMRDMYIDIEGYNKTKFNHAYAYGGAELAIKTINQNFGTDIRDYVTVDFFMLEKIIDEIGGIELEIDEDEYPLMNQYMQELANIENKDFEPLHEAGYQSVNGKQAVAYARIRKVGNGDFERTERQRAILQEMVRKVSDLNATEISSLAFKILPHVETSLDTKTILDIGLNYVSKGINTIEQDRFPRDGFWEASTKNGVWYMDFNKEETTNQLQSFIYNKEIEEEISEEVETINQSNNLSDNRYKDDNIPMQ